MALILLDSGGRPTPDCPAEGDKPSVPSASPPLSQNTEHKVQGAARRIIQYISKPRFAELLCIFMAQIQDAEDAGFQLATERTVDTAVGVQLDGLGDIVGQTRQGLSDDDYRPLIRARIRANNSEGTAPNIIDVAVAALNNPGAGKVLYDIKPPAGYLLKIVDELLFDEHILNDLIQDATSAGVRGVLIVPISDVTTLKTFGRVSDFPEFDGSIGFDSATTPGTGKGRFVRAMGPET